MRIAGGRFRNRPLVAPPGRATRPTSDRVREAIFNVLAHGIEDFTLEGARVLDLFAGTGALGLEALSRGAAHCTFVETDRQALDCLRRNVERLGAADRADIRAQAVEHVPAPPVPFDLVLIDPPYGAGLAQPALDQVAVPGWLAPGAWISVEVEDGVLVSPSGLAIDTERRYGKARLILLQAGASA